ncbi:MAG: heavy metal translocating P-type ATPase [Pirellulales bacterium]
MESSSEPLSFKIDGMDCAEEVALLKRELGPLVGDVDRLGFDIFNACLTVATDGTDVTADAILQAVARTGMRAEPWRAGAAEPENDARFWRRHGRTVLTATCGLLGAAALAIDAWQSGGLFAALDAEAASGVPIISMAFYLLGIVAGMWTVFPKAWRAVLRLQPDMNLLMTIAVVGAAAIGDWFESVTVAFLFSVSLLLESWSVGRARRAVAALLDLTPPTARLRGEEGSEVQVSPDEVSVGSLVVIKPGEKIPLDGRVVSGTSDVNQAPITGESVPVAKRPGMEVFAGTINGDGLLEIESTKPATDTTLAHIVRMVGEAESRRAPSERWVEQFARIYTPVVMQLALLIFLVPPLLFGGQWSDWFYRSLVLLVIACPCALVISTPVSIVASLASAARNDVLVKGGVYIETPARLVAMVMDKTGTLTAGRPVVVEVVPLGGHDEAELLERAAAMELRSNHPLAQAIVAAARERNVPVEAAEDFEIIQGKGATARLAGKRYWLGSHRYLEERGQETPEVHERLSAMASAGRTVVVVGQDEHVCGLIALADQVRPEAKRLVRDLHEAGVTQVVMLTGDNRGTAEAIARETGVDQVHAELLPEDKVQAVERLVQRYGSVAMVGDGVNDAPALARATIGIAMGAVGSDAAIETADIALMSDDLTKLPWLIRHSRRTLAIIRQNITFALAVKGVFVILTLVGFASLWAAIAADMGASLLVIFNGLRLLRCGTAHT